MVSLLPCEGVRFSLNGTTYQNNSLVTLEDIGERDNALLCVTDITACCRSPFTDSIGQSALGNWWFPNGTKVPTIDHQWDFHKTRGQSVVRLQRISGRFLPLHLLSSAERSASAEDKRWRGRNLPLYDS